MSLFDSAAPAAAAANRFQPRLFAPDPEAPEDPAQWRLRQAFEGLLRPDYKPTQTGTLEGFSRMLDLWEQHTADPAISEIDRDCGRGFIGRLEALGYSPSTIAKHVRYLKQILKRAEDDALIGRAPRIKAPKVPKRPPTCLLPELVDALYRAAPIAVWPKLRDVPAPDFVRAWICSIYNCGPRFREIFHDGLDADLGWLWKNYQPYLRLSDGTQLWSITFKSSKTGNILRRPVPPILQAHLERIRSDRYAIFPISSDHGSFYDSLEPLKAVAGIPLGNGKKTGPHAIRGTCQNVWDSLQIGLGNIVLDHADPTVGRFYGNPDPHLADMCVQIRQLAAFQMIHELPPRERQGRLV